MKSKFDPDQIITQANSTESERPLPPGARTDDDIEEMFDSAMSNCRHGSDFMCFLEDMHHWWETKGFLTEAQYAALTKAAHDMRR